jgi:Sybindin-like family
MRAYSVYICDRSKVCLFHRDWTASALDEGAEYNRFITMYGLFFQMKLFATAADPTKPVGNQAGCKPDGMRPTPIGEGTGFRCSAATPNCSYSRSL